MDVVTNEDSVYLYRMYFYTATIGMGPDYTCGLTSKDGYRDKVFANEFKTLSHEFNVQ